MRRNLDLIIILTLSVLVCGVLYLLYTDTTEYAMPKNGNIVLLRGDGYRRVAPRGTITGSTWSLEGMSGGVASSRSVRVSPQSHRRTSMQATSSGSSLVSSSRSLMSNGASNSVSIVGGNNVSFGRTAEANRSQTMAYGGGVNYIGVNVPSMRSSNPAVASSPSYVAIGSTSSAPYQPYLYGRTSSGVSVYGNASASTSTTPMSRVQQKAPPVIGGGVNDDGEEVEGGWLDWLNSKGYGETIFDRDAADVVYGQLFAGWNETMGQKPTSDQFWAWLEHNGKVVPLGDIAPLFLLAFAYLAMLLIRRKNN